MTRLPMQCNSTAMKKPEATEWKQTHIFENVFLQKILIISMIAELYVQQSTTKLFSFFYD